MPSKIHTSVAPLQLIPAHTCSFKGCLGLGINRQYVSFIHSSIPRAYVLHTPRTLHVYTLPYTQTCVHVKPVQASTLRLTQTSVLDLSLSSLSTTEPPVHFQLDYAFIREYHVLEIVVQICCSVLQVLALLTAQISWQYTLPQ
jgi:hypothetical protein